jgi:ABC-type Fe3+ transport system substrate-binding protein
MRSHRGLVLIVALLVAGCAAEPGASPSGAQEPASPGGGSPGAAGDFAAVEQAAKDEGSVVVWGPTSPDFQSAVETAFAEEYPDIQVEFTQSTGNEALARVKSEYQAGRYSVDIIIDGASTLGGLMSEGLLRPLGPELDPATLDGSNWAGGAAAFLDPEQRIMVPLRYVPPVMIINTDLVDPAEIDSWDDLADPKWKGMIAAMDPRIPSLGANVAWQLITVLGEDVFTSIYVDQAPALSSDDRQLSEWVARGQYAIGLGPRQDFWEPLRAEGLPLATHRPDDFAGWLSGGPALVSLLEQSPNPNAAVVFANWLVGQEGQTIMSSIFQSPSGRTDVPTEDMPDYTIPQEDAVYGPDEWDQDWAQGDRVEAIEIVEEHLGSS